MKKTEMHKEESAAPKEIIALEQHQIFIKRVISKSLVLLGNESELQFRFQ